MVDAICKTSKKIGIDEPHMVFLPPLPANVSYMNGKAVYLSN